VSVRANCLSKELINNNWIMCRVDLSAIAEKVIGMPPTPRISDIESAFEGLHDRIQMLDDAQQRMRTDLADEYIMIQDEVDHCISEGSADILSSHRDATAQIVGIIEAKDTAWKDVVSTMRSRLENIEETQSRSLAFCEALCHQQEGLDRIEQLLKNNEQLETSMQGLYADLAALASKPKDSRLFTMTQAAGAVANVAVGVAMFVTLAMKTVGGSRNEASQEFPSYPFELSWRHPQLEQKRNWDSAWRLKTPDRVLMMLEFLTEERSPSVRSPLGALKNYFLPGEGIHVDVLATDASLYLCQCVSIWPKTDMVCSLHIIVY
jgi:hypothetical protein